jgi:hypothetical protein
MNIKARRIVMALFVSVTAVATTQAELAVGGYGGFPLNQNIESMWLLQPDNKPLVIVYFHGPDNWHDTQWKIDSSFNKDGPSWTEFRSAKARLYICLNRANGEVRVQQSKFSVQKNNTFLVVNVTDAQRQKVIPLGRFDLPKTGNNPAAVALLHANPALQNRIQKETRAVRK